MPLFLIMRLLLLIVKIQQNTMVSSSRLSVLWSSHVRLMNQCVATAIRECVEPFCVMGNALSLLYVAVRSRSPTYIVDLMNWQTAQFLPRCARQRRGLGAIGAVLRLGVRSRRKNEL